MSKQRFLWLDYAKGIAILLVLYRHVFEGIKRAGIQVQQYSFLEHANIALFSFRMPLFFIISGIFIAKSLQKRGLQRFIETKAKTILYPYFLWGALQITLQILLSGYVNADRSVRDYTYLFYLPRMLEQFWYLYALFNVTVIYAVLKVKLKLQPNVQAAIGLVLFYLSAVATQQKLDLGFAGDILHYYIFFAVGDMLGASLNKPEAEHTYGSLKWFVILLPLFVIAQYYFLTTNLSYAKMKYMYVEFYQPVLFLVIALTGCFFMINVSFWLQKADRLVWLRKIGFYSLYIYVAHVLASSATRLMLTKALGINHVLILLPAGIFMGCLLPVLLYKLAIKAGAYWLFTLEKRSAVPE